MTHNVTLHRDVPSCPNTCLRPRKPGLSATTVCGPRCAPHHQLPFSFRAVRGPRRRLYPSDLVRGVSPGVRPRRELEPDYPRVEARPTRRPKTSPDSDLPPYAAKPVLRKLGKRDLWKMESTSTSSEVPRNEKRGH